MPVFRAEMGHLLALDPIGGLWQKDEMVAKFSGKTRFFIVARIDKELEAVPFAVVWVARFVKGLFHKGFTEQSFIIPRQDDISKMVFSE